MENLAVDLRDVIAPAREVISTLGAGAAVTVDFVLPDHPAVRHR